MQFTPYVFVITGKLRVLAFDDYHNIGVKVDFEGVFEIIDKSFPVKSAFTWIFR